MKVFYNNFWFGFLTKTDPISYEFFNMLLSKVFEEDVIIDNLDNSDILVESIFNYKSVIDYKKWKYTFLFSGESYIPTYINCSKYNCVLFCQKNHDNFINLPLFMCELYGNPLIYDKIINNKNIITIVPSKDICTIISNGNSIVRNTFLNNLEQNGLKIDYLGKYKHNTNGLPERGTKEFYNFISNYKIIITMENSNCNNDDNHDYITEKILHGFVGNNISVYWGAKDVNKYFNEDRFINVKDINNIDYINKIKSVLSDDKLYLNIVNKRPIYYEHRTLDMVIKDIKSLFKLNSKIIGFLSNKLTLRGTEIAMYDYADCNETILNNKSIIITRDINLIKHEYDIEEQVYTKFKNRFTIAYYKSKFDIDNIVKKYNITHLYIIKAGYNDGLYSSYCKNLIHVVFTPLQPHGDIYSVISNNVNKLYNTNYPVVPHMIRLPMNEHNNMRTELNIPENDIVFGRYGGKDTFNISFVYDVIKNILNNRNDIYFIFMNTNKFYEHDHIIYLDGTSDMIVKKKFINTCDALLHARDNGETFGLTCGEFAICEKPVITYKNSKEYAHIDILGDKIILYSKYDELYKILSEFSVDKYDMKNNGYMFYTPENVMDIFNKIYLQHMDLIKDV